MSVGGITSYCNAAGNFIFSALKSVYEQILLNILLSLNYEGLALFLVVPFCRLFKRKLGMDHAFQDTKK